VDAAELAVLTEAGLIAAPLLVMFAIAVRATNIGIAAFRAEPANACSFAGLTSHARDRAPPRR
jgi:hypothetical protein